MFEAWLHFATIIFVQALLFVVCAYRQKRLSDMPRILGWGIFTGIGVGLLSDLIWGKFFGLWSYTLGFGVLSLTLTAALVYGLFAANILLMRRVRLLHFFIWIMVMMATYEVTNHFFRVWTYELALPTYAFLMFLVAGYFATAFFIAVIWHAFLGYRFSLIDNLLRSKV